MLAILGLIAAVVGAVLVFVGGIWFLIEMFKTSVLWGLGGLFVPCVTLIWLVMNWEQGKSPFLLQLGGSLLLACAAAFGGVHIPRYH